MHVGTICAAVDLRRAHFHQLKQLWLEPAVVHVFLRRGHRPQRLLAKFVVIIILIFTSCRPPGLANLRRNSPPSACIDVRAVAPDILEKTSSSEALGQFG